MTSKQIRNSFLLILAALIWGTAFVFQSTGADELGPYTMNSIRFLIGGCALLPVIRLVDRFSNNSRKPQNEADKKNLFIGGIVCGFFLFWGSTIQQLGIYYGHSTAKAGFITATYILIVPILGIFLKKKCGINIWIGVILALVGLYFICGVGKGEGLEMADGLLLACALFFSFQIQSVDHYSPLVDGIRLSCIQFFVSGILGLIPMCIFEMGFTKGEISNWCLMFTSADAWVALLYCGLLSSGVAYTLQIVGQEGLDPTIASLLMSLESVFAALAGALILKEVMSLKELLGCALIFVAIIVAQLNFKKG